MNRLGVLPPLGTQCSAECLYGCLEHQEIGIFVGEMLRFGSFGHVLLFLGVLFDMCFLGCSNVPFLISYIYVKLLLGIAGKNQKSRTIALMIFEFRLFPFIRKPLGVRKNIMCVPHVASQQDDGEGVVGSWVSSLHIGNA